MSFIDISDNEYDRTESEGETDELYTPITPSDSPDIFFSDFHNNSNLNNFFILPSVPETPPTTPQQQNEPNPHPPSQHHPPHPPDHHNHTHPRVQVEIEELNVIPQPTSSTASSSSQSSSLPSPPLLPLNDHLIHEPVQLNDIFSLPQLIQNLQL